MPKYALLCFAGLLQAVLYCVQTAVMIVKAVLTKSTSQVLMSQVDKYWLDFGTNKYKPYALQGGATDLHMPFVAQVNPPGIKSTALCTSLHIP